MTENDKPTIEISSKKTTDFTLKTNLKGSAPEVKAVQNSTKPIVVNKQDSNGGK